MQRRTIFFLPILLLLLGSSVISFAQPTWTLDPFGNEKKPEQYEEKILGSEKTATKKFTKPRHFIQNTITHYNFYFNANNKLRTVLESAKMSQREDYSKLLPFYPYSLENTAAQKTELDSVIYKCTAGILLHDLRNDWVDNLYLLIGQAYFLQKEFDSAAMAFQFINYNLFPRKKNEDDGRLIGTNDAASYNVLSISNREKRNIVQKALSKPPSRNDALIWLTRTTTDQEQYGDAAGLINILTNDPNLPKRLRNDLEEVTAYWFYKQGMFDSAAIHLEKGITTAEDKPDKARWEFLLAQLFEMSGNYEKASDFYGKAAKHTVQPEMDIYARLNDAKMFRNTGNEKELNKSIENLLKMAKKDKFESYRHIIYYSTGQLSLQKADTTNGMLYYSKSVKYNESSPLFKNKAFLQMGNISYDRRDYKIASAFYDSLNIPDTLMGKDFDGIEERRNSLRNIVTQLNIIEREDSLQMISKMAPAERDAFIKKLVKKYKGKSGGKEEESSGGSIPMAFNNKNAEPADLFAAPSKGEWYFYNSSMKSKGLNEFKSRWGKRENIDNWSRLSVVSAVSNQNANIDIDAPVDSAGVGDSKVLEFSYDGLLGNVPLSPETLDSSNGRLAKAFIALGNSFQNELEDYPKAIETFEEYLRRFPDRLLNGEVYLSLYYCYNKIGNTSKASYYKNLLSQNFSGTHASDVLNNPAAAITDEKNPEVTAKYERIYGMFIEGNFATALQEKQQADSIHGSNYWTPQLLYISAVNFIKERKDSLAISELNNIVTLHPKSPLKDKALTMIDVLKRRSEIEDYLSKLEVTRAPEEDRVIIADDKPVQAVKNEVKLIEPKKIERVVNITIPQLDSIRVAPSMKSGVYVWKPDQPHSVVMILTKVDPVYINEAKNAFTRYNIEKFRLSKLVIAKDVLDNDRALLVTGVFETAADAVSYFDKIKKAAAVEVSWLPANKYSFFVISPDNLELLKTNKDFEIYRKLLNNQYPGKF